MLYGDWIDLSKCDITYIHNIINAEGAIKRRNAEEIQKEEQRKEAIRKEKEAEKNRIEFLSSLKKVDAISIRNLLLRNGIKCFYHFTTTIQTLIAIKIRKGMKKQNLYHKVI